MSQIAKTPTNMQVHWCRNVPDYTSQKCPRLIAGFILSRKVSEAHRLGWIRHAAANQVYMGIFGFSLDSSGSLRKVCRVWGLGFFLGFFWFFAQGDE